MGDFWLKSVYFLVLKKNEKRNMFGVSVHSEGDEEVNRQRGPESRPSMPAGRGGGAAGPAAGGGVPAAGGSGAGAPGPRAGAAHRPERGGAHQRRGAGRPGGAAQVPPAGRGGAGHRWEGHTGGRGGALGWAGRCRPGERRCCFTHLPPCLSFHGKGSRGKVMLPRSWYICRLKIISIYFYT